MRHLILVLILAAAVAAEDTPAVLAEGATKDIQYVVTRQPGAEGRLVVRLTNRLGYDARVTFSLIAGVGDRGDEPRRTVLIPKDGSWNASGKIAIATAFAHPGIRVDDIERGTMEIEEGTFFTADGDEMYSSVYRWKPLKAQPAAGK